MLSKKFLMPALIFISLIVMVAIYWWGYNNPSIGIDDANIYFVYMKNFAEGHGFVWNIGGEKVEGFTSLVWTLIGSVCYKISPTHFYSLLLVINFLLIFFTLQRVLLFARQLNNTENELIAASDVIILSLLLLPLGFIEWGIITLMETGLWTFLLVHLTLQLCDYFIKHDKFNVLTFSLKLVLLDMTRPESIAYSLIFVGILFLIVYSEKNFKSALRTVSIPFLIHIITFASIISWRLSYFGFPFPNTYYAKVSGSLIANVKSGGRYLVTFFYYYPHAALVSAIVFLFLLLLGKRYRESRTGFAKEEKVMAVLLTVISCGMILPVLMGGDHFRYSRFYQPLLPLLYLALCSVFFWKNYIGVSMEKKRLPAIGLMFCLVFGSLFFSKSTVFDFTTNQHSINYNLLVDFTLAREGRKIGEKLNETFVACKSFPSLGALATGGVGFAYKGNTIDLLGLNNTTMAHASRIKVGYRNHASFDKKGFWKLKPDMLGTFVGANIVEDTSYFILPENTEGYRNTDFVYICYKGIFDDSDFRNMYVPALVKNKDKNYFVFTYYSKPFLAALERSGCYVIKTLKRRDVPLKLSKN